MTPFGIAALSLGIVFLVLGSCILTFRSKAQNIVRNRFAAAAKRYEDAGRTRPQMTGTVPGGKFIVFLGVATILIGFLALVLALSQ